MKKLIRLLALAGIVTWLTKFLKGDTAAGEWHTLPKA